jgi:hypothetical protein
VKRDERERAVGRIREAAAAWLEADREMEAMSHDRERIARFVDLVLHPQARAIESVDHVPAALRQAWRRSGEGMPDRFAVMLLPEYQNAARRRAEAYAHVYTPAFVEAMRRLRAHRPSGIDDALVFLEANPFCFHSGYDKQRIVTHLRHMPLTNDQQHHLRAGLLNAVREGAGVEFRDYCRTAVKVDTDRFRAVLRKLRDETSQDPAVRGRAGWMLDALIRTNGQ